MNNQIRRSLACVLLTLPSFGLVSAQEPIQETGYLKPGQVDVERSGYGWRVCQTQDQVFVSAPSDFSSYDTFGVPRFAGAVHVYDKTPSGQQFVQKLSAPPTARSGEKFGSDIAADGCWLVVGAERDNTFAHHQGSVYIYKRSGGLWALHQVLGDIDPSNNGMFGRAVALEGTTLVVSSPSSLVDSLSHFELISGNWQAVGLIPFPDGIWGVARGGSLALSGGFLAAGIRIQASCSVGIVPAAPAPPTTCEMSGAVVLFERSPAGWSPAFLVRPHWAQLLAGFGIDVAMSGSRMIVGASGSRGNVSGFVDDPTLPVPLTSPLSGAAFLYSLVPGVGWVEDAVLKPDQSFRQMEFGHSVDIQGDYAVVGAIVEDGSTQGIDGDPAPGGNPVGTSDSGAAYVFRATGHQWDQVAYLKASNADAGDHFGSAVSIHEGSIVVGAILEASASTAGSPDPASNVGPVGAAYLYRIDLAAPLAVDYSVGANVSALSVSGALVGGSTVAVELDLALTGQSHGLLLAFARPTLLGPTALNQWLLVGPQFPAGSLLPPVFVPGTPVSRWNFPLPLGVAGFEVFLQGVFAGAASPLQWSNGVRLRVGN